VGARRSTRLLRVPWAFKFKRIEPSSRIGQVLHARSGAACGYGSERSPSSVETSRILRNPRSRRCRSCHLFLSDRPPYSDLVPKLWVEWRIGDA
jgi:hypothetical protein